MNPTTSTRRTPPCVFLALTLALILAALPASAQRKRGKKTFSDTTSVVVVEVPVTVTRDGEPVDDLTPENFEVTDGKTKQKISGFEIVDLKKIESFETLERPVPIAARRHFLMLFDLAWSEPESVVKARSAARDLVDNLHPADLAGVATYTSTQGANILLNFTADRRQLELAIQTLGSPKLVQRARDPLGLVFGSARDFGVTDVTAPSNPAAGGTDAQAQFDEIANEQILDMASQIAAAERANNVNKVSAFTGNLEALADLLASIDGRKHMVYFSEGIPNDVLVGEDPQVDRSDTNVWDLSGDEAFGHTQSQNQLEDMVDRFRRAGCAIQSVDIGGLRAAVTEMGARASGEEGLVSMARDTGGDFYRNFNDLGDAMGKMLQRTSVTYVLAFQPQNLAIDGAYHRLRIKLVGAPRGTKLSHRAGYYAPKPDDQIHPMERRLTTAELVMSENEGGPLDLDVLAMAFPVKGEKSYVPLLFEIGGKSLLVGDKDKLELEVYAYATSMDTGAVYDFFVHPVGLDVSQAQVKAGLEQTGLKYWGHFDLPPGRYTARVMVRDRQDGRHSLKRQTVIVPEFESAGSLLLPPMFPEAPGKWVLAREGQDRQREVDYPFMAGDQPYIPAVKPVVPAKGTTPFYLQGLNLASDASFEGTVMSAEGTPAQGVQVKLESPSAANGVHSVAVRLETQGLAPGEYTLVGKATDASGEPHSSSIRFVVR